MPARGLHKENVIKALPVWTVAVGAAILFICALLIAQHLGDDRARPSPRGLGPPVGSIAMEEMEPLDSELADGATDASSNSVTQAPDGIDAAGGADGVFGTIDFPREAVAHLAIADDGSIFSAAALARSAGRGIAASAAGAAPTAADAAMIPASAAPADAASTTPRASDGGEPRREDAGRDNVPGTKCGNTLCPPDQVCCNASCGTCTPPGGTCSQQICTMENPAISVPCGPNTCNVGQVCCNASCGICTEPGQTCSQTPCANSGGLASVPCGLTMCNAGQVCCNATCGICTAPGQTCDQTPCGAKIPFSVPCGLNTCNEDQVCCNPSCSTCAPPGQSCDPTPCL